MVNCTTKDERGGAESGDKGETEQRVDRQKGRQGMRHLVKQQEQRVRMRGGDTWLLIKLTLKGVVFSFLFFFFKMRGVPWHVLQRWLAAAALPGCPACGRGSRTACGTGWPRHCAHPTHCATPQLQPRQHYCEHHDLELSLM